MEKKNYLIVGGIAIAFIIVIFIILMRPRKGNWTDEILKSNSYEITMTDCNNRQKTLDKSTLDTLSKEWHNISNNGPWTGNNNICYNTITISYENDGIIKEKEILLIDNNSLVLNNNGTSTYYVGSEKINKYLQEAFKATK